MMSLDKLRRIAVVTLVTITTMACGILSSTPVAGVETQQPTPGTSTPAVVQLSPTAIPVIASPVPTNTFTPAPPPVVNNPPDEQNRIKFTPGATWAEVGTHLKEGDEIRYVLSASKGQVMSVSVEQSWPFVVQVASVSGPLTDAAAEHPFWRGVLPVTGDYTILVKTDATGDFTLRVAINPPGQAYQYFDYTDPRHLYTLRYSDEFTRTTYIPAGDYKGSPDLVLGFINPDFYGPTTNLGEAYFMLSTITDPGTVATCTQPFSQLETTTGHTVINSYDFTQSEAIGAAAGNIYDQVIYRTTYKDVCYEVVFYMHSGNIGNYPAGTVVEFDRASLVQKFEQILSTFTVQ